MSHAATRNLVPDSGIACYQRHRSEQTLLYRIVEQHYPAFIAHLDAQGKALPEYVRREFEGYLKCGRLEHGFMRLRCDDCHAEKLVAFSCKRRGFCPSCGARRMAESAALLVDEVFPEQPIRQWVLSFPYPLRFLFATRPEIMSEVLGIVYRVIARHLTKKAGATKKTARAGRSRGLIGHIPVPAPAGDLRSSKSAVLPICQRFGSALNLNIHFHMLFLDGVYDDGPDGQPQFRSVKAPSHQELTQLAQTIATCVGCFLERKGLLEADAENSYLAEDAVDDDPLSQFLGHSITYRIALGPQAGRKVFILQTQPPGEPEDPLGGAAGKASGLSFATSL